jgi:hypothetical protein
MLLLLAACMSAAPVEPPVAPAPAPAAEAPWTQLTLALDPDELRYDDDANTVTVSPGSAVRSAQYTHYVLDLDSLEAVLGARPTEPVSVTVEVGPPSVRTETPSDPMSASPSGGFEITTYTGRVVSSP